MTAMHHTDKGARRYFRASDQQRNRNWQSICSELEHLSDGGADVLATNPAAKSRGEKNTAAICGASAGKGISKSNVKHFFRLFVMMSTERRRSIGARVFRQIGS